MFCWGGNTFGQLDVPRISNRWDIVKTGHYFSCGVRPQVIQRLKGLLKTTRSRIFCWGQKGDDIPFVFNDEDQAHDRVRFEHKKFNIRQKDQEVVALAAGAGHVCAGLRDIFGRFQVCGGANGDGQSDIPHGLNQILKGSNDSYKIRDIFAGQRHTCTLNGRGSVKCFGWDKQGQVSPPSHMAKGLYSISLGFRHTCYLREIQKMNNKHLHQLDKIKYDDGKNESAKINERKRKIDNDSDNLNNKISKNNEKNKTQINEQTNNSLTDETTPKNNSTGSTSTSLSPLPISLNPNDINTDSVVNTNPQPQFELGCWGSNREGQAQVRNDQQYNAAEVCAGYIHTCARVHGKVRCWGSDDHGQCTIPRV